MKEESLFYMDEINIRLIIRDLIRNVLYILLAAISCILITFTYKNLTYQPEYTSSATLAVMPRGAGTSAYNSLATAVGMAETMTEVFGSSVMKAKVEEVVGEYPADTVTEVSVLKNTNLMTVSVTASAPQTAYFVIQAILDNYNSVSDYLFANAVIEIISNPLVPVKPSNPVGILRYIVLAGGFGCMLMGGVVLIHSICRQTIKTKEGARRRLNGTCLGVIGHEVKNRTWKSRIRKSVKGLLLTNPLASFAFEETYYRLANQVDYVMKKNQKKILMVSSVAENEGKTTVTANLALALARKNKKVVLIDCDLRKPAMYRLFDKTGEKLHGFEEYVEGKVSIRDLLLQDKKNELFMIFNFKACKDPEGVMRSEAFKKLINGCAKIMDYVILDTAPMGYCADTERLTEMAEASMLIVKQDCVLAEDINDAAEAMTTENCEFIGYVLNDFAGRKKKHSYGYYGAYEKRAKKEAVRNYE